MLVLVIGLILTTILLMKLGFWGGIQVRELGSMSHQWVAAYHAAQHSSSV